MLEPTAEIAASGNGGGFALHAWIDESIRWRSDGAGTYVLAAAVGAIQECDSMRSTLRDLLRDGQHRLHWRDEDDKRKTELAEAVSRFDIAAVVVVGSPVDNARQERARRKCMEVLLPYLDQHLEVTHAWMESRTSSLNKRDRDMVAALRGARRLRSQIRVHTALPMQEPMLWLPDIVAGAIGAAWIGVTQAWRDALGAMVTELPLTID